jgi:hypothetical protein
MSRIHSVSLEGLEHLKIETRLIGERSPSVIVECFFLFIFRAELKKKAKAEGKTCHATTM